MYQQRLEEYRDIQAAMKEMQRQHEADVAALAAMEDQNKKAKVIEGRLEQQQIQVSRPDCHVSLLRLAGEAGAAAHRGGPTGG